ncbi:uncharacterized protein LOC126843172 [Adelges cooleyi]|uniref:uncharacterized protein LOC126843172 n=1 Tax=Adelges cooleyi TaxID=133065 RepID=UPI00217FE451|nr:uncharacterized protein LOC126843172 [Adelges cooleyi]XP_050436503.1 uncharacterized protein LOC126843172 [Adelges cooleyi]
MAGSREINLDFLQLIVDQTDPGVKITKYETSFGSKRGDNYTSMVYRVLLYGDAGWTKSMIYKVLPKNVQARENFKSEMLFDNEVRFYKKAHTALMEYQDSKNIRDPFVGVPKCYFAESDIIVLEDMRCKGFVMMDRLKGLDLDHCRAVLKVLGKFHGLSLSMKANEPEKFQACVSGVINEVYYKKDNELWYGGYYKHAVESAKKILEAELTEEDKPKYLDVFKQFVSHDSFFGYMTDLVLPKSPLDVLCHGDCWTNNFLVRYTADGDISEVSIVDFQIARYGSPALDLTSLLYCCTTVDLRSKHLPELLQSYYDSVISILEQTDCMDRYPDICQKLNREFLEYGGFGLGVAMDLIPIITCESDQAPDMYKEDTTSARPNVEASYVNTSNDVYRRMIVELVKELVDNGCLK